MIIENSLASLDFFVVKITKQAYQKTDTLYYAGKINASIYKKLHASEHQLLSIYME